LPIIRKVMDLRTAKAICLPKSWLEFFERETGCEITEVAIEVNNVLRVSPILSKKAQSKSEDCATDE
jgi:hypothetical protein